ncbi:response regulator transcription factor [Segetibacter sp. 3557_3]|uniref:response regulator n=1 Tax=Segetibacter sp. 3557_3 TaxID=2547429 RepID=UPI001058CC70|nr:response regulator [Segetibacter sp. 3557_3]TDH25498.1 response regulator transcription factor [Segetibacter sp. 3557_3]
MEETTIRILLIEDDIDDVDLLNDALQDNEVVYNMQVIMDGDKVYDYLHSGASFPEIIIMDLNLPKTDGKQILKEIKASTFKDVPLLVLTTSSAKEDIDYCYSLGANKFLTKPATIEDWNYTINSILKVAGKTIAG